MDDATARNSRAADRLRAWAAGVALLCLCGVLTACAHGSGEARALDDPARLGAAARAPHFIFSNPDLHMGGVLVKAEDGSGEIYLNRFLVTGYREGNSSVVFRRVIPAHFVKIYENIVGPIEVGSARVIPLVTSLSYMDRDRNIATIHYADVAPGIVQLRYRTAGSVLSPSDANYAEALQRHNLINPGDGYAITAPEGYEVRPWPDFGGPFAPPN